MMEIATGILIGALIGVVIGGVWKLTRRKPKEKHCQDLGNGQYRVLLGRYNSEFFPGLFDKSWKENYPLNDFINRVNAGGVGGEISVPNLSDYTDTEARLKRAMSIACDRIGFMIKVVDVKTWTDTVNGVGEWCEVWAVIEPAGIMADAMHEILQTCSPIKFSYRMEGKTDKHRLLTNRILTWDLL